MSDEQRSTVISYVYAIEFAENLIGIFRIVSRLSLRRSLDALRAGPLSDGVANALPTPASLSVHKVYLNKRKRDGKPTRPERRFASVGIGVCLIRAASYRNAAHNTDHRKLPDVLRCN